MKKVTKLQNKNLPKKKNDIKSTPVDNNRVVKNIEPFVEPENIFIKNTYGYANKAIGIDPVLDSVMVENGAPNIDTSSIDRAYYDSGTNTIHIGNRKKKQLNNILAEIAHSKQYAPLFSHIQNPNKEDQLRIEDLYKKMIYEGGLKENNNYKKSGSQYDSVWDSLRYEKPGTIEHEAHSIIEPKIIDDYITRYNNYVDAEDYNQSIQEDMRKVTPTPALIPNMPSVNEKLLNYAKGVKKFKENGYVYDDALGGVAGGDPMTMGIKMAADKINKKKDQILGGISTAGTMIYGLGNMPDQYSDEKMSKLGMGLQGASVGAKFGGIPGALVGGGLGAAFGWYTAKKNNIEKEEQDYMREMAYIRNSVVGQDKGIPMAKKGGKVKDKFHNTETYFSQLIRDKNKYIIPQMFGSLGDIENAQPIVHIQTEKGEAAVMADGGIVDVKAKVLHDFMNKDKVTDVFPEGTFIASSRKNNSLKKDKAEKIVLGHTPVVYDEFENEGEPKEVKMSDIFVKKEQTPAELAKIIAKKFKTVNKLNDVYSAVTNEENKIGRLPYLMKLIEMTEKKKGIKETQEQEMAEAPLQEKAGGYVKKFQNSGTTELESLYKNYSDKLGDFNNKYQQEYSDYFKYARAANAGANLLGAVGTGLQSSSFTPAFKTNRYADQMFSKVPQYLRESAINQAQKPINTIARNMGVLNTPTSTLMGSLGNITGRAIDSANNTNRAYTMDDITQDRNRGRFLQDTENYNIAQQANADNFTRRQDNQKISQGFGYGARALTTDASLKGSQLGTQMQLDRAGIEGPFSAAAQMAQLKMMDNIMKGGNQNSGQNDVKALLDGLNVNKQKGIQGNTQENSKYSNWLSRYRRTWNEDPNIGNFNEWVAKLPKFTP